MVLLIWVITILVYVVFRLWYDGLRKPLTAAEVEEYTRLFEERAGADDEVSEQEMNWLMKEFVDIIHGSDSFRQELTVFDYRNNEVKVELLLF